MFEVTLSSDDAGKIVDSTKIVHQRYRHCLYKQSVKKELIKEATLTAPTFNRKALFPLHLLPY